MTGNEFKLSEIIDGDIMFHRRFIHISSIFLPSVATLAVEESPAIILIFSSLLLHSNHPLTLRQNLSTSMLLVLLLIRIFGHSGAGTTLRQCTAMKVILVEPLEASSLCFYIVGYNHANKMHFV